MKKDINLDDVVNLDEEVPISKLYEEAFNMEEVKVNHEETCVE